jgi:DNA-binding transcriptional regulator YiaG
MEEQGVVQQVMARHEVSRNIRVWARAMRRRGEVSQSDIARKLNMSRASYGCFETGRRELKAAELVLLVGFWGCRFETVLAAWRATT